MIVYENVLENFITECKLKIIADKVAEKMKQNRIPFSESEDNAWQNSLAFVSNALDDNSVNKKINVAIEYRFDLKKGRIDFLAYGLNENNQDSVVIVELKQWSNTVKESNKQNFVYTYGGGGLKDYIHPSLQAYSYRSTLEEFNSFVQDNNVDIESCSYLHNLDNVYESIISNKLKYPFVEKSPVFFKDDASKLRDFINKNVKYAKRELLYEIDNGKIRPSNNFSKMLYDAIEGQPVFTLDDEQQNSVSTIIHETEYAIEHNKKKTIIIKGGPGTGKSVVAINALGQLMHPREGKGHNVCYCTPNYTPRELFSELLITNDYTKIAIKNLFKTISHFSRCMQNTYDCVIVDEAHRAFQWKFGNGLSRNVDFIDGIFNSSLVNVFFIDEDQIVTKDDYLTIERIKEYANKFKSEVIESEDLHLTSQYRCVGGYDYINFINSFLKYPNTIERKYKIKNYEFKVFDNPSEMWNLIKEKQNKFAKTRLLAGYTHDWISKNNDSLFDFKLENDKFKMRWNKNVTESYINDDTQMDRIGSIHTIQGVDMDYAGVIIGEDLIYRNGKIIFNKLANANTDNASGIKKADNDLAERLIRNTYKVLLTRAIYGTYVYCEDKELNNYLKSLITNNDEIQYVNEEQEEYSKVAEDEEKYHLDN